MNKSNEKKLNLDNASLVRTIKLLNMTRLEAIMRHHNISGKVLAQTCVEAAENSDNLEEAGIWESGISRLKNGTIKYSTISTLKRIINAVNVLTGLDYNYTDIDEVERNNN